MKKNIIIDVRYDQTRVAVTEDDNLVELYIEDIDNQRVAGNIYRGKVTNVLPGMQAAFIDIGLEKNAFLYVDDINTDKRAFEFDGNKKDSSFQIPSIKDILKEGQELTVQVTKEAIGTKGARVTTNITLPGRYLVLMPKVNYIGVSRRINDEEERQRLKNIAEEIKPESMGLIVRTASLGKEKDKFLSDLDFLLRLWEKVEEKEFKGNVPRILHKDRNIVFRTIRDIFTAEVNEVVINDYEEYKNILEWIDLLSPRYKDKVKYFDKDHNIFKYYGLEKKIEKAIQKKVWLKNGGYIVIDTTEALTAIDVNTGKYVGNKNLEDTVLKTNFEAAEEIARQIRLRDIGGIIIIDFIDMEEDEHRQQVLDTLTEALKKDRTKTSVIGFTGLGLVEMTRKKVRERLAVTLLKPCPYCNGTGKVYSMPMILAKVEKEIEKTAKEDKSIAILVELNPEVAKLWIEDGCRELELLEDALNTKLLIKSNYEMHVEDVDIHAIENPKELKKFVLDGDNIYTAGFRFEKFI